MVMILGRLSSELCGDLEMVYIGINYRNKPRRVMRYYYENGEINSLPEYKVIYFIELFHFHASCNDWILMRYCTE